MNINEIIGDALRYPLSDWKKILILGIFIVLMGLSSIFQYLGFKNIELTLLSLITLIIFLLVSGYQYRIIKLSLSNIEVLPEFNAGIDMFVDGIKVTLVSIIYLVPGILIIGIVGIFILVSLKSVLPNLSPLILILIAVLYTIIIIPISLMAIAYMADNDSKFSYAFRFREILNKISSNGWTKFILWYIVTGIIFLVLLCVGSILTTVIGRFTFHTIGIIFSSLVITPYIYMYLYRSVALFYMSK